MSKRSDDGHVSGDTLKIIGRQIELSRRLTNLEMMAVYADENNMRQVYGLLLRTDEFNGERVRSYWIFNLVLDKEHPHKAPHVQCMTENPRYVTDKDICLNGVTHYHNESACSSMTVPLYMINLNTSLLLKDEMGSGIAFRQFPTEAEVIRLCRQSATNCWLQQPKIFETLLETRESNINLLWVYDKVLKKCEIMDVSSSSIDQVQLRCFTIRGTYFHHWVRTVYASDLPKLYVTTDRAAQIHAKYVEHTAPKAEITPPASTTVRKTFGRRIVRAATKSLKSASSETSSSAPGVSSGGESSPEINTDKHANISANVAETASASANVAETAIPANVAETASASANVAETASASANVAESSNVTEPEDNSSTSTVVTNNTTQRQPTDDAAYRIAKNKAETIAENTMIFMADHGENEKMQAIISQMETTIPQLSPVDKLLKARSNVPWINAEEVTMCVPEYVIFRFISFWEAVAHRA